MIIGVRHPYVIDTTHGKTIERELRFSDFRNVKGTLLPFEISESQGGQHLSTIRLTDVSLNVGLSSAEFEK
jgi:outer membrane lipoprotein-sorting protein